MNEDPGMPDTHPEAQLASFVDGSATDQERRQVETHLAGCATCRADLDFATRGRAAMQALPNLESPGLAKHGLSWLPQASPEPMIPERGPIGTGRTRRRSRFRVPIGQRLAWGGGIAVAAGLAAVFLFANLQGGGSLPSTAAGGGQAAESSGSTFARVKSSTNYDQASVGALATRLVQQERSTASDAGAPVPAAASQFGAATPSAQTLERAAATQAEGCLQRAAGIAREVTPSYVEVAAFEGTPAFIGAFHTSPSGGAPTQLLVVAASRADCRPLYVVTLPL